MRICRKSTFIAVAIAGILQVDSLQSHNRNELKGAIGKLCSAHGAFISPLNAANVNSDSRYRSVSQLGVSKDQEMRDEDSKATSDELGRIHDDREDHTTIHDDLERKSIEYIDKQAVDRSPDSTTDDDNGDTTKGSNYFDWEKVRDNRNALSDEVTKSVDSTGSRELEKGERPSVAGHGTDSILSIEEYPTNVDTGRLNEWNPAWKEGEKVMSFFPIIVDEYSLLPSPLQLGFEDPVIFRGKYVDMTFNSLLEDMETPNGDTKQIYGMCFINPSSGQLAPLAVYAELISREASMNNNGEQLKVKGRVLGRVILHQVVLEEPFIKAKIIPMEDDPKFTNADDVPKLVDEITSIYDNCNKMESEMMELLKHTYAVARIKERPMLHDLIDKRLNIFNVDLSKGPQAFAQIAAYSAFDYHLTPNERYEALSMQNSFDRLRYVRDHLKLKLKQLNILKKAPREKLQDIVKQMRQMKLNREEASDKLAEEMGEEQDDELTDTE
ncbi:hypothetical protein BaOVIS_012010 [Babesia ovis]|uniref:Lon N-terminal domain-containing protein n=1 Tax=Babesia ovis TaxID=5869 RepID=A0A9W5T9H7_BABOV|nr:hypothetical protein BaOVIS_012010 [Babesia ovis]